MKPKADFNAPTYLCFLKSAFGFIGPDLVEQIRQAALAPGLNPGGSHATEILQTLEFLRQHNAADIANHTLSGDQIRIAYLLANPHYSSLVAALSIGATFFGANTYIGNGPNFMIKSIADHQQMPAPTFLGYIFRYTLPFMVPMLVLVWLIFFRQ